MIARLLLSSFRNHESFSHKFEKKIIVVSGYNGLGKTNLLEALTMLAQGRGLRSAKLDQILFEPTLTTQRNSETNSLRQISTSKNWSVFVELNDYNAIGVGSEINKHGQLKKQYRLNGDSSNSSEIADILRIAWITPQHDRLFSESNGQRRRFLDRLIAAHDPSHGISASRYDRAMRQRNKILTDYNDRRKDQQSQWLNSLEIELSQSGTALAVARLDLIAHLNRQLEKQQTQENYSQFICPKLDISGFIEDKIAAGIDLLEIENQFQSALQKDRFRDAKAGRTLIGPHRSEFTAQHRLKNIHASLCSTGEQKAMVVSLFLANAVLLKRDSPDLTFLLLLDEGFAHLDSEKRRALLSLLSGFDAQSWITTTDDSLIAGPKDNIQIVELQSS